MRQTEHDRPVALAELSRDLVALDAEAAELGERIEDEAARQAARVPWSEVIDAMADRVMPLSAKEALGARSERKLASLERRRVRLQREGWCLQEQCEHLRARIQELATHGQYLVDYGASLRSWSHDALQHGAEQRAWVANVLAYQRLQCEKNRETKPGA